jgi:hypothetical protein
MTCHKRGFVFLAASRFVSEVYLLGSMPFLIRCHPTRLTSGMYRYSNGRSGDAG